MQTSGSLPVDGISIDGYGGGACGYGFVLCVMNGRPAACRSPAGKTRLHRGGCCFVTYLCRTCGICRRGRGTARNREIQDGVCYPSLNLLILYPSFLRFIICKWNGASCFDAPADGRRRLSLCAPNRRQGTGGRRRAPAVRLLKIAMEMS